MTTSGSFPTSRKSVTAIGLVRFQGDTPHWFRRPRTSRLILKVYCQPNWYATPILHARKSHETHPAVNTAYADGAGVSQPWGPPTSAQVSAIRYTKRAIQYRARLR